jgi:O-antigen/teichoic acid export membrane protein
LIFKGDWIIVILFGKEFAAASTALSILCLGQIVNVLMGSVGLVLNMTGNEKSTLRGVSITLVLNIILLAILIPPYKEVGAAIAVCASMICWNLILAYDAYRLTKLKTWLPFGLEKR